ncbi:hypothetical protein Tco_0137139, partial [Tanacetum coccineum]
MLVVNIPYLLARYLRLFASRKKRRKMISRDLSEIDMAELVRLQICEELVVDEGAPVVPVPTQAPQPPAQTMAQRLERVEEEVHEIRRALKEQRELMDDMARDLSRFTVWAAR